MVPSTEPRVANTHQVLVESNNEAAPNAPTSVFIKEEVMDEGVDPLAENEPGPSVKVEPPDLDNVTDTQEYHIGQVSH